MRCDKAAAYARERSLGRPDRRPPGVAHPLAKRKIEVELARLMTQKAAWLHDMADAGRSVEHGQVRGGRGLSRALDQAIQTHGGNGLATEYGLATLGGLPALQRTAPVSREMIFNYVAQHSLRFLGRL